MTRILVAGSRGFIGGHLLEYLREMTDWDATPQGGLDSPDYIVHLAGCSQIDKSIASPLETVTREMTTTLELLEFSRACKNLKKFLYFSSDEVFGPQEAIENVFENFPTNFKPWDRYNSHSPYAAGKAACEELCLAWASTYGVPIVITHCQNLIGERQPANKFLPTVVRAALQDKPVYLHWDEDNGSWPKRNYLHVKDAVAAIVLLLQQGEARQKYNIATDYEISNYGVVCNVATAMGATIDIKAAALPVRPGFFVQHGLNGKKLQELGWERKPFVKSLHETVLWMVKPENRHWLGL